jgi:hypothetical protein
MLYSFERRLQCSIDLRQGFLQAGAFLNGRGVRAIFGRKESGGNAAISAQEVNFKKQVHCIIEQQGGLLFRRGHGLRIAHIVLPSFGEPPDSLSGFV